MRQAGVILVATSLACVAEGTDLRDGMLDSGSQEDAGNCYLDHNWPIELEPPALDFGLVPVGEVATKTATISNECSRSIQIRVGWSSENAAPCPVIDQAFCYQVPGLDEDGFVELEPNGDLPFGVSFAARSTVEARGVLAIWACDSPACEVDLRLRGAGR